ncbi:hypothetical protein DEU56DRAFT_948236 [Suillus clintonianus]|uniref:uncharacterized protein n=1 Tax=Suillus clintonianus TaxID=1904413 RepID=UPI001B85EB48|nr:uncharacterized protein DEU56DRAFT_948236 [Suillus clintonianus]KAG2154805.1 hypothetical protein DEU56DRAFT_948236 [Suillus clintonianus]
MQESPNGNNRPNLQAGLHSNSVSGDLVFHIPAPPIHNPSIFCDHARAVDPIPPSPRPITTAFEGGLSQSGQSSLGASSLTNLNYQPMLPEKLVLKRLLDYKYKKTAKQTKFLDPMMITLCPLALAPIIFLPFQIVDKTKKNAWESMMRSLFQVSLFPSQLQLHTLAQEALNSVVSASNNDELVKWKLRKEGQCEISRLKGAVKTIYNGFTIINQPLITAAYQLSLDVSVVLAIASCITQATTLLSNFTFLDGFMEHQMEDGRLELFVTPFANHALTAFLKYLLHQQQLIQYVSFSTEGWPCCLKNTITVAGTFCGWGLRRCLKTGWFADAEFDTPDNEACYAAMISRIDNLAGNEKIFSHHIRVIDAPFVPHLRSITNTSYFPTDEIDQAPAEALVADSADAQKDLAFLGCTFKRFTIYDWATTRCLYPSESYKTASVAERVLESDFNHVWEPDRTVKHPSGFIPPTPANKFKYSDSASLERGLTGAISRQCACDAGNTSSTIMKGHRLHTTAVVHASEVALPTCLVQPVPAPEVDSQVSSGPSEKLANSISAMKSCSHRSTRLIKTMLSKGGRKRRKRQRFSRGPGGERKTDIDSDKEEEDGEEFSLINIRPRVLGAGYTEIGANDAKLRFIRE